MGRTAIYEVDVAHGGETWEQAQAMIIDALDQAMYGYFKAVRVIHGYGSLTGQSIIGPRAISLMRHLADTHNARFAKDNKNPGVSLIWLNKPASKKQAEEKLYYTSDSKCAPRSDNWFDQALKASSKNKPN